MTLKFLSSLFPQQILFEVNTNAGVILIIISFEMEREKESVDTDLNFFKTILSQVNT